MNDEPKRNYSKKYNDFETQIKDICLTYDQTRLQVHLILKKY